MRIKERLILSGYLFYNWCVLVHYQLVNWKKLIPYNMTHGKATYALSKAKYQGVLLEDVIFTEYPTLLQIDKFIKEELD